MVDTLEHTGVCEKASYGRYAPDSSTSFLRFLTRCGLSRGVICKWIRKQWRKKGFSIVDTQVRGINFRLHTAINTTDGKLLTSSKFYDHEEIRALSIPLHDSTANSESESVFIDIGANTGYYSLTLAQLGFSKILAIEPNPTTLSLLRYNVGINDFGKSVTIVPLCVGDGQKTPFYSSETGLGSASIIKTSHHDSEPILVDSAPLLNILTQNGISHVSAMKIDIEGYEDRALQPFFESAPKSLWPEVIVIEDCNRDLWQHDIIQQIEKAGYKILKKTRGNQILKRI